MIINPQLFEAYLKCATKCYLKSLVEAGTGNAYAEWLQAQNDICRSDGIKRLTMEAAPYMCVTNPSESKNLKTTAWRIAINFVARAQNLESMIHAVERVPSEGRGKSAQLIPVRYVFNNKPTKSDKLLLAFDALVLSKALGRKVNLGKILHGDNHTALIVKTDSLEGEVRKAIDKIVKLLSAGSPPDLILNRHCAECEFQKQCRRKAIEKDELSLLARMTDKERKKLHVKGIFTITQLSYTFRPRRRPKRVRDKREKYHHSLKALAIREKKIHVVGAPELRIEGTPVYLDVEGLPDIGFYYLIGVRFRKNDADCQYSLWADNEADEKKIWNEFLCLLATVENPVLICYGSYEKVFIKEMCERYGGLDESSPLTAIIKNPLNLLLTIYARIYFPVYSNGLKDIAGLLGFKWSDPNASGIQSIIWRKGWEHSHNPFLKQKLTIYNAEDCEALSGVTDYLGVLTSKRDLPNSKPIDVVNTDTLPRYNPFKFQKNQFLIPELEEINRAAYWDYQREKIFLKSNNSLRKIVKAAPKKVRAKPRINKVIRCLRQPKCPRCGELKLHKNKVHTRIVFDIQFSHAGIKRWIVKYLFYRYRCTFCRLTFYHSERSWSVEKYGPNIRVLAVYLNIDLRLPLEKVAVFLNQVIGFEISRSGIYNFKSGAADYYKETYQSILRKIIDGQLVHADETKVNLHEGIGYVWVFTSLEEVVYIYSPSREGELLADVLKDFKGVLVSDFYTAYDSLKCPQQKCLIHLIRDMNEDLLKEPFNQEMKSLVADFAALVKPMIDTVDRYGLKARHLRKHKTDANRFFKQLSQKYYFNESAVKCKKRLEKNRTKLFTFLDYNGVPWNNNNAEHAIKAFAWLRRDFNGHSNENGIRDYLILLSICETCKYKGLSFLDFLRSGEKDIDAFALTQLKRRRKTAAK